MTSCSLFYFYISMNRTAVCNHLHCKLLNWRNEKKSPLDLTFPLHRADNEIRVYFLSIPAFSPYIILLEMTGRPIWQFEEFLRKQK